MTYRLDEFGFDGMIGCTQALRHMGANAKAMQDTAEEIVRFLRQELVDADGRPACALVRLYKTHAYGELPPELQKFATGGTGSEFAPNTRVLTLLATAGDELGWNDPSNSKGHRAIALPDADAVGRYPMIAQLIAQLGLDVADVVAPDLDVLVEHDGKEYNVFYVGTAIGSPSIPAQDFVEAYGIASAFGFGGMLPGGDMYAVVLFSRVPVSRTSAQMFRTVALGGTLAMIAAASLPLFRKA